jgi:hypothetical protein
VSAAHAALSELDSATQAQLDAIETDAAASVGYLTTLVSRLTSNAATAIQNLFHMITGTGVTSKYTADALENAPGASGGLTDEQDELLTAIGQRTAQISGSRMPIVGPVTAGGQINLVVGSDYVDDLDSSLIRTVTDAGQTLYDSLTVDELTDLVFSASPSATASSSARITGTIEDVSHAGGVTAITIAIDRTAIPAGPYGVDWKYQIWRVDGELITPPLLEGTLVLNWRA